MIFWLLKKISLNVTSRKIKYWIICYESNNRNNNHLHNHLFDVFMFCKSTSIKTNNKWTNKQTFVFSQLRLTGACAMQPVSEMSWSRTNPSYLGLVQKQTCVFEKARLLAFDAWRFARGLQWSRASLSDWVTVHKLQSILASTDWDHTDVHRQ